jgi:hypothetical protein
MSFDRQVIERIATKAIKFQARLMVTRQENPDVPSKPRLVERYEVPAIIEAGLRPADEEPEQTIELAGLHAAMIR